MSKIKSLFLQYRTHLAIVFAVWTNKLPKYTQCMVFGQSIAYNFEKTAEEPIALFIEPDGRCVVMEPLVGLEIGPISLQEAIDYITRITNK